jgi:hypothetical protein
MRHCFGVFSETVFATEFLMNMVIEQSMFFPEYKIPMRSVPNYSITGQKCARKIEKLVVGHLKLVLGHPEPVFGHILFCVFRVNHWTYIGPGSIYSQMKYLKA